MTITLTDFGTGAIQAAAGGTNATDTAVSGSHIFAADDLVVVAWGTVKSTATPWTVIALTPSVGSLGAITNYASAEQDDNPAGAGYVARSVITVARVTAGFTGTVTVQRTPGSTDHWDVAGFYHLTGQDLATPVAQSATATTVRTSSSGSNVVTPTLGSAPAATSAVISTAMVNALGVTFTAPSGHTMIEADAGSWGSHFGSSYIVGSGAQANAWTSSGTHSGLTAVAIEIAQAAASGGQPFVKRLAGVPGMALNRGVW